MTLDDALIQAHAQGDKIALVALYREAASKTSEGRAKRFYLTQAYIFALEIGTTEVARLKADLVHLGADSA